jgi:hypothetical protein
MNTYETILVRPHAHSDDEEIDIIVEYTFYKGCRGSRDSLGGIRGAGPPIEPDEPAMVEIEFVRRKGDNLAIELTDSELVDIEGEIMDMIGEEACDDGSDIEPSTYD